MRTLIYTGKGGVGKTSLASATALASARRGHRTMLLSTDSAHSLGDSLQVPLGPEPREVEPRLFAQEVDVLTEMEEHWKEIYGYLTTLLSAQGVEEITAKEAVVFPGMELITALLLLERYRRESTWDVVVVDTAPTADTLRLLSFPDVLRWYFEHVLKFQRGILKVARPTVGRVMRTPLPSEHFFDTLETLYTQFQSVRELLSDAERTSVRLVLNPQKMVISETQRAYTYLCLFDIPVEMLVVNRVLPSSATGDFLKRERKEQQENLHFIREAFGEVPQREVPRYPEEVLGKERLLQLARDVFGEEDPTKIFARAHPVKFYAKGGRKYIRMELPFAERETLDVSSRGDTLYLKVGWYKRTLTLPFAYAGAPVARASFDRGVLLVEFAGEAPPKRTRGSQ